MSLVFNSVGKGTKNSSKKKHFALFFHRNVFFVMNFMAAGNIL